jgi:hypothetical protein
VGTIQLLIFIPVTLRFILNADERILLKAALNRKNVEPFALLEA